MIGLQLAARACYNPASFADVFRKLGEFEEKQAGLSLRIPAFLQTHPLSKQRVRAVRTMDEAPGLHSLQ